MICAFCGNNFIPNPKSRKIQVYCSVNCNKKSYAARNAERIKEMRAVNFAKDPEKYRDIKRKYAAKPEAIAKKQAYYESHRAEIFARILSKPDFLEQQKYSKRARRVLSGLREKKCDRCGRTDGIIDAHHISKPRSNNSPDNLMWLCRSRCHSIVHGRGIKL